MGYGRREQTIGHPVIASAGKHRHAISRTHASTLRQDEHRVDLGLDQAVTQLGRHARERDDDIDQGLDISLGTAAKAIK